MNTKNVKVFRKCSECIKKSFGALSSKLKLLKEKCDHTKFGQKYQKIDKRIRYGGYIIVAFLLICLIIDAISGWKFSASANLLLVAKNTTFCVLAGYGMMFIFSGGLIDLSVGANILLSASLGAFIGSLVGDNVGGLIVFVLVSVIASIIFGQISVQLSLTLKIPPWIAGLGAGLILESVLQIWISKAGALPKLNNTTVLTFFSGNVGTWILLFVAIIVAFILFQKTTIGINLQAVGRNPSVSRNMGINAKKTILIATIIGAVFVGLSAVFTISYNGSVSPQLNLSSLSTIFKVLAVIMLADAIAGIFTQPIAIVVASIIIASSINLFSLVSGITDANQLNLFLGIIVVLSGILSHLHFKGIVK